MKLEIRPKFGKNAKGKAAPKLTAPFTTDIVIDNTDGGEDLKELKIVYLKYGTSTTAAVDLASKLKKGKIGRYTLPNGTHPCAFYLLWRGGSTFFRWVGDGAIENGVISLIEAEFGVDESGILPVWDCSIMYSVSH